MSSCLLSVGKFWCRIHNICYELGWAQFCFKRSAFESLTTNGA
uniref:Uncharacterized protein n=1 Tax=Arundo donax TaxID=35708 RepID=A0A0A8ZML8_ARUDO